MEQILIDFIRGFDLQNIVAIFLIVGWFKRSLEKKFDDKIIYLEMKIDNKINYLEKKFDDKLDGLSTRIDSLSGKVAKIDERLIVVEKRLFAIETILHMKDCCLLKDDKNNIKAE